MRINTKKRYSNRKTTLDLAGESLTPRVTFVQSKTDRDDSTDRQVHLEFYCKVNVANHLKNKKSSKSKDVTTSTINFKLADKPIAYFKKKAKKNGSDMYLEYSKSQSNNILRSKKNIDSSKKQFNKNRINKASSGRTASRSLDISQINKVLEISEKIKTNNTQNLYNSCKNVGNISLKDIKGFETIIKSQVVNDGQIVPNNSITTEDNLLATNSFKNIYTSMITNINDPMTLFQNSYSKSSFKGKKKGLSSRTIKSGRSEAFLTLFKNFQKQINKTSKEGITIRKVKETQNFKILKVTYKTSLRKIRSIGDKIHVLMFCKNRSGLILESSSYYFGIDDILNQINTYNMNYSLNSARLASGVSVVSLMGQHRKGIVNLDLHAKSVKRCKPFEITNFNLITDLTLQPGLRINLKDGKLKNRNKNFPRVFKSSENIFYRSTLNYFNKKYGNAKATTSKSRNAKEENIPYCAIHAKNSQDNKSVIINVSNISNNVEKIKLLKYRFKGNVKGELLPIVVDNDLGDNTNLSVGLSPIKNYVNVRGAKSSYSFQDYDVYRTKKYMYVVECLMKNGEKRMAPYNHIHSFDERSGSVRIENIEVESKNKINFDDSNYSRLEDLTRVVNISFQINKIETQIDKILENLFGDLFDVFKTDLEKIKDTQGLVYSVEIVRIDQSTGESETIGKVTADKEGNCIFIDRECPALSNITYAFLPRVAPVTNLIDEINETISKLGSKTIFNSLNYAGASNRRRSKDKENLIHSKVGNKYTNRSTFLKGLVETPKFTIDQKNLDIFLNTETGDIEYADLLGIEEYNTEKNVEVGLTSLREVKNFNSIENKIFFKKSEMDDKYFDLSFEVKGSDFFVDFYAIFIKEKNDVYLDGALHSGDSLKSNKSYSYLINHKGSLGLIEYYLIPFYKDGTFSQPKIITTQIIT